MAAGDVVRELLPALWLIVLPYVTFAARVGCRRFGARAPPHRPRRSGLGPLLDHPLDYLEASLAPIAATVFAASHSVQGRHGMRQPLLRTLTLCVIHGILGSFLLVLALLALGAPLAGRARETFSLGCFLAALLVPSLSAAAGARWDAWHRCVLQLRFLDRMEQALVLPAVAAAAGAWLGAVPLVLDWDMPWQRYPVPVALGAVVGRALGGLAIGWLPPPQRKQ